ncbi:hypothetical protein [Paenibacillus alvei]|uniref:hypothetical protein n=2 Tax=Paenibacillus alvei TaxID=44250 RepID=UPI0019D5AE1A|nr:hypothetical protein [Paenibacillus alvei]
MPNQSNLIKVNFIKKVFASESTFRNYIIKLLYKDVEIDLTRCKRKVFEQSPNPDLVDIRLGEGVRMWETQCPNSIYEPLLLFHEKMGLTFGVYDFKVDQNGTPFFLEVNPSGQWLDMELQAGHPISGTWARVLVEGLGNEHDT